MSDVADLKRFTQKTLIVAGIGLATVALALFAWEAAQVLLLVFAGVLLAILLRSVAHWLARKSPLSLGWALGVTITLFLITSGITLWLVGPNFVIGLSGLLDNLTQSFEQIRSYLQQRFPDQQIVSRLFSMAPDMLNKAAAALSTALGALVNVFVILVLGLYFAIGPGLYRSGVIRLVPPHRRPQAATILFRLGHTLRWWLAGRLASMTVVGLLTWIGLLVLGLPFAATLAALAALLSFVPNIGPILSAIPALLIGLTQSPAMAIYVAGLYLAVQTVESYFITPLIQERAVSVPPALIIAGQFMMALVFGGLGLLLATPLLVLLIVLVQELYVQDVLGEHVELADHHRSR